MRPPYGSGDARFNIGGDVTTSDGQAVDLQDFYGASVQVYALKGTTISGYTGGVRAFNNLAGSVMVDVDAVQATGSGYANFLFLDTLADKKEPEGAAQGEIRADLKEMQLASLSPLRPLLDGEEKTVEVWGHVLGQYADREPSSRINGYRYSIEGGAVGADFSIAPGWTVGAAFGFAGIDTKKDGGAGEDEAESYSLGLRADYQENGYFLSAAITGSLTEYEMERVVGINGTPTSGRANPDGKSFGAALSGGKAFDLGGGLTLRPIGSLAYVAAERDGYVEQGLGGFGLTVQEQEAEALRVAGALTMTHDAELTLEGTSYRFSQEYKLGVAHEEALDDRLVSATALGTPLSIQGDDESRTLLTLGAGLSFKLTENAAVFAGYDGQFGGDFASHGFNAGLRVNW